MPGVEWLCARVTDRVGHRQKPCFGGSDACFDLGRGTVASGGQGPATDSEGVGQWGLGRVADRFHSEASPEDFGQLLESFTADKGFYQAWRSCTSSSAPSRMSRSRRRARAPKPRRRENIIPSSGAAALPRWNRRNDLGLETRLQDVSLSLSFLPHFLQQRRSPRLFAHNLIVLARN